MFLMRVNLRIVGEDSIEAALERVRALLKRPGIEIGTIHWEEASDKSSAVATSFEVTCEKETFRVTPVKPWDRS